MRAGALDMIMGLSFGNDPEAVNLQIAAHMRRDLSPDLILDVICAFSTLSAAKWPGAERYFRLYVQIFPELWAEELETLPVVERAVGSVQTLQAMGAPIPVAVERIASLSRAELARRVEEGQA